MLSRKNSNRPWFEMLPQKSSLLLQNITHSNKEKSLSLAIIWNGGVAFYTQSAASVNKVLF